MSNKPIKTYVYRPTSGMGAIISCMVVILLLAIDFMVSSYGNWHFRQYATLTQNNDEAALNTWHSTTNNLAQTGEYLHYSLMITIISMIFVAKWVYDSHCNARALGVNNIKFSPLMSAAAFFIPIANLFIPFVAMRDMVNGSFEKAGKPTFHGLILLWWVCFISGSLIHRFYGKKSDQLETQLPNEPTVAQSIEHLEQLVDILTVIQIGSLLSLISAAVLIVIILRTNHLHQMMFNANKTDGQMANS